jgi:1-acyl-sn-glycerol-3-phosphate acyltransferase
VTVQVEGLERLDPKRSYVFAANHQSIYDIPILFASLPFQLRIISKESIGRIPFMGWHLQRTGHVLVDRAKPGAGVVKKMARLVAQGHSLIVFPEGTRSTDGTVARFKGGPFVIALQAGLPVVPITLVGSRHVMFRGDVTVRPGRVKLVVHDPIETAGVPRDHARDFAASVREIVASKAA